MGLENEDDGILRSGGEPRVEWLTEIVSELRVSWANQCVLVPPCLSPVVMMPDDDSKSSSETFRPTFMTFALLRLPYGPDA
jgi:hypothetical protein